MFRFRKEPANRSDERAIVENLSPLYGFALSLTRNRMDAEDLVQETCVRALKALSQHGIKSDPKVWLFTILRNTWINQWRRHARGPEFVLLGKSRVDGAPVHDGLADGDESPDSHLERNLETGKIRGAIANLPEVFREVVVLRYFEGFSYREIASILGCPAGTVMSRLSRAKAELRSILDEKNTLVLLQRKRGSG